MKVLPVFGRESRVPEWIAGLEYGGCEIYEDQRLGVSFRYGNAAGVKADAYLYDLGMSDVPDDLHDPAIVELFQQACGEVFAAGREGMYLDLELWASQYLQPPGERTASLCLWAAFSYRQAPGPYTQFPGRRISHLALRTDRGLINKVRYTYPAELGESQLQEFVLFLLGWTEAVQAQG